MRASRSGAIEQDAQPPFTRQATRFLPNIASDPVAGLPQPDLIAALPRLRRYARVLTGDPHRADDLVQDALARAWEKRRLWRAGSDLRAWLFTIMHNVHVNQFSMRQREAANASLDADDGPAAGWEIAVRATQSDRVELSEVLA